MSKPFRFAVQSFSADSAGQWRERARRAETLGYSALHLADHVIGPGPALESTRHPLQELAAVPAMAVAAEATTTLRVGCRVFCQDYRHPAVLAKEAATLDLLSEGRLELGLGAGWLAAEYEAMGLVLDPPATRIARLAETIAAVKAHMSGEPISLAGEHVKLAGYRGAPRPVQRPGPPIMVGGGSPGVLRLAGREADVVSINLNNRSGVIGPDGVRLSTAEETHRKLRWVREGAGERFADLELEIGAYFTFVGDAGDAAAKGMAGAFGISEEAMRAHPHALFGSVDAICTELTRRREEFGIHYVTVGDAVLEDFAPVVARLSGELSAANGLARGGNMSDADAAIRNLVARYTDAVLRRDVDAWRNTWTADGEWKVLGDPARGRENVVALWQKLMSGIPFVMQLVHSGQVQLDGETGRGRWLLSEVAKLPDGRANLTLGVYHDRYEVEDGTWRFAARRFDVLYMGPPDLSAPVQGFPEDLDEPL